MRPEPARSSEQRRRDVLARLETDVDLWVASADEQGGAYLIPLSYYWDGTALTVSTPRAGRTAVDLMRAGWARVALGHTRDVVIVEGTVEAFPIGEEPALGDAHAAATGFDPARSPRSTSTCGSRRATFSPGASPTSSRAGG